MLKSPKKSMNERITYECPREKALSYNNILKCPHVSGSWAIGTLWFWLNDSYATETEHYRAF
jgi:hypothetical protein